MKTWIAWENYEVKGVFTDRQMAMEWKVSEENRGLQEVDCLDKTFSQMVQHNYSYKG